MMFDFDSVYSMEALESLGEGFGESLLVFFASVMAVLMAVMVISWLANTVLYVIRSLSLYTIAHRRGLKNPWLSWIPVGRDWIIGSLSDQFKYLTEGKNQSRRKILLGLGIAGLALSALSYVPNFVLVLLEATGAVLDPSVAVMLMVLVSTVVAVVSFAVSVTKLVFHHMSMYEIYRSCNPKNAVLFLVLGILFGITEPFFLLACREKDLGMPPRKKKTPAGEKSKADPEPAKPAEPAKPVATEEETVSEPVQEPEEKPVLLGIGEKAEAEEKPQNPPTVIPLGPAESVDPAAADDAATETGADAEEGK